MEQTTLFARWMAEMDFGDTDAARALGISRSHAVNLRRGRRREAGNPRAVEADRLTRLAMAALANGLEPYGLTEASATAAELEQPTATERHEEALAAWRKNAGA